MHAFMFFRFLKYLHLVCEYMCKCMCFVFVCVRAHVCAHACMRVYCKTLNVISLYLRLSLSDITYSHRCPCFSVAFRFGLDNLWLHKAYKYKASVLGRAGCLSSVASAYNAPPRWPSGKASASRAEDPGFESCLHRDFFRGQVIPVTSKLALQWLPCQALGVIGSVLGLVGPGSVYCDWVR